MTARDPVEIDLNRYLRSQEEAEKRHDLYGDKARQSIVDDLFSGRKAGRLSLHDFCEEVWELIERDELAAFLMADRDTQHAMTDALRKRVEKRIRDWCEGNGAEEVDERTRGMSDE